MSRPRRQLQPGLRALKYNPASGKYEITEDGITYLMDFKHTITLKRDKISSMKQFYADLDRFTKEEIIRIGMREEEDDFYPDVEYEE